MKTSVLHILALATALSVMHVAAPAPAEARNGYDFRQSLTPDEARRERRQGNVMPVREAVAIVRARYPVRELLDAFTTRDRDGTPRAHIVRVVTYEGRLLEVAVDARSGKILSVR